MSLGSKGKLVIAPPQLAHFHSPANFGLSVEAGAASPPKSSAGGASVASPASSGISGASPATGMAGASLLSLSFCFP